MFINYGASPINYSVKFWARGGAFTGAPVIVREVPVNDRGTLVLDRWRYALGYRLSF